MTAPETRRQTSSWPCEATKLCFARCPAVVSWPGLSRPSTCFCAASKDVDTRTRPGMTVMGRCVAYGSLRIVTARMKPAVVQTSSWPGEATKLCFAPTSRPSSSLPGEATKLRFAPICPGHPVLSAASKDVDARHKAGHDGDGAVRRLRSCSHRAAHETAVVKQSSMAGRGRRSFASRPGCPGHPRSLARARTWIPGTRPGMTVLGGASLTEFSAS